MLQLLSYITSPNEKNVHTPCRWRPSYPPVWRVRRYCDLTALMMWDNRGRGVAVYWLKLGLEIILSLKKKKNNLYTSVPSYSRVTDLKIGPVMDYHDELRLVWSASFGDELDETSYRSSALKQEDWLNCIMPAFIIICTFHLMFWGRGGGWYQEEEVGWTCGMWDIKNAYNISIGTSEGHLGYLGVCWKIILQGVDLIHLVPGRDRGLSVLNTVINLCVP